MTIPEYDINNPKLDIYINGYYAYSTNWYESIDHYLEVNEIDPESSNVTVIEA